MAAGNDVSSLAGPSAPTVESFPLSGDVICNLCGERMGQIICSDRLSGLEHGHGADDIDLYLPERRLEHRPDGLLAVLEVVEATLPVEGVKDTPSEPRMGARFAQDRRAEQDPVRREHRRDIGDGGRL